MTEINLFASAKIAGHALYDSHRSGLIYHNTTRIVHANLNEFPLEIDEDKLGEEEDDRLWPMVDDFEYQFMPSSNTGVDAAGESITSLVPDVDGNIYLYSSEAGIRVIHSRNDYFHRDGFQ